MNVKQIMLGYLFPTQIQILLITFIAYILKKKGVQVGYGSAAGIILIVVAGISSALWGIIYQIKAGNNTFGNIIKDFFNVKQSITSYLLVILFLLIVFGGALVNKGFKEISLGIVLALFLKAILFGGIEEIGWRYTFQPTMEGFIKYIPAVLITFIFWGIWHFAFFYIDGSLSAGVNVPFFLLGLLTNCFILSSLYAYSGSLWICVMTHALINTFSQIEISNNEKVVVSIITKILCIVISVMLYYISAGKKV